MNYVADTQALLWHFTDRAIIVSIAKYLNVTIITKDEMIRSVDHIKTVW